MPVVTQDANMYVMQGIIYYQYLGYESHYHDALGRLHWCKLSSVFVLDSRTSQNTAKRLQLKLFTALPFCEAMLPRAPVAPP